MTRTTSPGEMRAGRITGGGGDGVRRRPRRATGARPTPLRTPRLPMPTPTPRTWPPARAKPMKNRPPLASAPGWRPPAQARGRRCDGRWGRLGRRRRGSLGRGGGHRLRCRRLGGPLRRRRGGRRAHERNTHPGERRVGRLDDLRHACPPLVFTDLECHQRADRERLGKHHEGACIVDVANLRSASDHHARVANFRSAFHDRSLTP